MAVLKRPPLTLLLVFIAVFSTAGCAGRYVAKKYDPVAKTPPDGFHYFLPKPYLLVTNMTIASAGGGAPAPTGGDTSTKPKGTTGTAGAKDAAEKAPPETPPPAPTPPSGSIVSMELIWLPDLQQEYVIDVKGVGIGTFKGSFQLENGWMLTGLNEESDAKVAETLTAASGLLSNIFSAAGLGAGAAAKAKTVEVPAKGPIPPFVYLFAINLQAPGEPGSLKKVDTEPLNTLLKAAICSSECK